MHRIAARARRASSVRTDVSYLTHEEQVFVLHQIRNWVLGRHAVFEILNAAWSEHGAEAYFWN